jgi:hypothetical protein
LEIFPRAATGVDSCLAVVAWACTTVNPCAKNSQEGNN